MLQIHTSHGKNVANLRASLDEKAKMEMVNGQEPVKEGEPGGHASAPIYLLGN